MEISNETRDRLVKDLSDDELKQELASREERKPGLYRYKVDGEVVLFTDEHNAITVLQGNSQLNPGMKARRWAPYTNVNRWTPVTLIVKE